MYEEPASAVRCDMVLHRAFSAKLLLTCKTSSPLGHTSPQLSPWPTRSPLTLVWTFQPDSFWKNLPRNPSARHPNKANLHTTILGFRRFGPNKILFLRGGTLTSIGNFLALFSQQAIRSRDDLKKYVGRNTIRTMPVAWQIKQWSSP